MNPTLAAAAGLGFHAALREAWLVPVGALVGAARRAALWPALAVLGTAVARAAFASAATAPLDPAAPLRGALVAIGSARLGALVLGLALAGMLLSAALRIAWLAGALPTLGLAIAGAPREPRFATGIAYGLPRVLACAALGLAAEAGATGFALTLALAALRVAARMPAAGVARVLLLTAACALAWTLAFAAPLVAGVASDAAVARAAIRGEGPARAFAGAVRRLLARPGSFLLGALAFASVGAVAPLAFQAFGGAVLGFARTVPAQLLAGPNLMLAALAVMVAAALDVWWLGTIASLACGRGSGNRA